MIRLITIWFVLTILFGAAGYIAALNILSRFDLPTLTTFAVAILFVGVGFVVGTLVFMYIIDPEDPSDLY